MSDYRDVIAAFADHEPVPADELAIALADSTARDYFIDILVLRGLVGGAVQPRDAAASVGAPGVRVPKKKIGVWLTAAAALVTVGIGAGFLAGRQTTPSLRDASTPAVSGTPAIAAAPAPTHVIRMENGVDWNERSGGN